MKKRELDLIVGGLVLGALAGFASVASAAVATQVSVGFQHTCAVDASGGAHCWGLNSSGQVGDGTNTDRTTPAAVSGLASGVASVSAGARFSCAVTTGGAARCWGSNSLGYLGDGTGVSSSIPVDVAGLGAGVESIAAGVFHACAVLGSGGVKCWGSDLHGQLGDGAAGAHSNTPVDVVGIADAVAVTTGPVHTCALTSTGAVKCWGYNADGQLGDGTTIDSAVPVDVVGLPGGILALDTGSDEPIFDSNYLTGTCVLTSAGGIKCWGGVFGTTPADQPGLTSDIVAFSMGRDVRGLALTSGGAVKSFQQNGMQVSSLTAGIAAVSIGFWHDCVLTTAGEIKCKGTNDFGELGEGNTDFGTGSSPGCVVGFGDSDFDHICDLADPCTGGQTFLDARKPVLTLARINADPTPGDDRLRLKARFELPGGVSFADLDPIADGGRLTLVNPGGIAVDWPLAAGAYAGPGTAGWTVNGKATMWRYTDATTTPPTVRATLVDRGHGAPGGEVDLTITRMRQTIPVGDLDLPLQAIVVLGGAAAGSSGRCAQSDFGISDVTFSPECTFNPQHTNLTCRIRR